MAFKYRDRLRGTVTTVQEPKEVEAAESNAHRGKWLAMHQRRTIEKMDNSTRWERVNEEPQKTPARVQRAPSVVQAEPVDKGEPENGGRPGANDPKADWVDWAVEERGYDPEEAESLTLVQLKEL